ncbi:MAG TPA: transposase [Acidobacteriota bacterium]|nr:transposase [Acidobacteriota bacterium]
MTKIAKALPPRQLTPYAEETLHALTDAARRHGHLLDLDLSLPNLSLLLASVLVCSFHAALKRLHRLTQNERFDPQHLLLRRFARLASAGGTAERLLVLVDWTSCGAFDLLVAALALEEEDQRLGRAMLLYAEAHPKHQLAGRKNRIEKTFLARLREACHLAAEAAAPERAPLAFERLLFVFDRGFAKDTLLGFLCREGFRFIVRAKLNVRCLSPQGRSMLLENYVGRLASGTMVKHLVYKHKAAGYRARMNLVVCRRRVGKRWAQWYLWTNLEDAEAVIAAYERRFSVEESFKDAKTHWKLEQRRIQYAERMDRYLALLALLQAELCQVGLALLAQWPALRRQLGESGRNRLSLQNLLRRVFFLAPEVLHELDPSPRCL